MQLVSIIIPCYNYGWLLAETLDSVLAQSHTAWECIVIDDGSSDNTREVANRFVAADSRFRYVHQENGGMSAARNHGLRLATGVYTQFLDADDLLTPRKLQSQVARFQANPHLDIVYGDMRYFRHGAPEVLGRDFNMGDSDWMVQLKGSGLPIIEAFTQNNKLAINSALTSSALIKKIGGFDESFRHVEDWDFWLRCALAGATFQYDADPGAWVLVRLHPTSTSNNRQRMIDAERRVREVLFDKLKALNAREAIKINAEAIDKLDADEAVGNIRDGKLVQGIRGFLELAYRTKRPAFYMKNLLYWLRYRALHRTA